MEQQTFISSSDYISKAGLRVEPCLAGNSGTQGDRVSILASAFVTAESAIGSVTNHTLSLLAHSFRTEAAVVNSDLT